MVTFILGASDPEMQFIKEAIQIAGLNFIQATYNGQPVKTKTAYRANGFDGKLKGYAVFVECQVEGVQAMTIIDHHQPGDPGYERPPEQFWEASSIGQTINFICRLKNRSAEAIFGNRLAEYRLAAAADHCLCSAYLGLCPGINPDDLSYWRTSTRATYQNVTLQNLLEKIDKAKKLIVMAPKVEIEGVEVAVIKSRIPELPEASAQMGAPIQAGDESVKNPRLNIISAPPAVIDAWIKDKQNKGLELINGDSQRGFAKVKR